MRQIIVASFADRYRAVGVLDRMRQSSADWAINFDDAVAVYRDGRGQLRLQQSYDLTMGERAGWGDLWRSLIMAALAVACAREDVGHDDAALGAAAGADVAANASDGVIETAWWREKDADPDVLPRKIGAVIGPGESAIFALMENGVPKPVVEHFRGYGSTLLRISLTEEQTARVKSMLVASA